MGREELTLKLRMLWLYRFHFRDWWRDVWKKDAASSMCCSGYECGCMGADYWSYWEWMLKDRNQPHD